MSDGEPLTESRRLEILIINHTNAVDKYDESSIDRIKADSTKLNGELIEFNKTQQKESLFVCLFELMKTTSELHFKRVLKTIPAHSGESDDLNTLLRRIFTIESKWHTTESSKDLDDSMRMTDEFIRLSKSSMKCPIPSILFLDFFLYVCNEIVLLLEPLKNKRTEAERLKKIKDEEVVAVHEEEDEKEEEEEEEDETQKHGILMVVVLIGKVARYADNEGILNDSVELNNIEYLTPENRRQVENIRNEIVELHRKNIRDPTEQLQTTGQLQITLSFSSAIGYFCEESEKKYVPSARSGHTQPDEVQDTSPPTGLRVRNLRTQQFLNDSPILREMARQDRWCPFMFKKDGCYDRSLVHRGQFKHPDGYNPHKRYFYDIRTYKVVMIDPRAWPDLYKFTHIPNSIRAHPYPNPKKGGRNSHNISRRLKKQHHSIRMIHHDLKNYSRSRKLYITKHTRRTRTRTHRRTTRRRRRC